MKNEQLSFEGKTMNKEKIEKLSKKDKQSLNKPKSNFIELKISNIKKLLVETPADNNKLKKENHS